MVSILGGIRIIELGVMQVGPHAAAILGDLGAEVIKVEEAGRGDPCRGGTRLMGQSIVLPGGRVTAVEIHNRNKKSIAIDLRKEGARDIMYRLVEKSDVFMTNLRPQAIARFGLDYNTLSQHNPRLIYAAANAWGQKGPEREKAGQDSTSQAQTGLMFASSDLDMPPIMLSVGLVDQVTAIMLAYGVVAALLARERLGVGQEVTTSQLACGMSIQALALGTYLLNGAVLLSPGRDRITNPLYTWYKCKDDRWILLGMYQLDRYWPTFCAALGMPELQRNEKFQNATEIQQNSGELISIFDTIFATKTYDEWAETLGKKDLIFSPINRISDLTTNRQVTENEYIVDFDHPTLGRIKVLGQPIRFSKTPGTLRACAPECGQHTEEVLLEICGYDWAKINELRTKGVL